MIAIQNLHYTFTLLIFVLISVSAATAKDIEPEDWLSKTQEEVGNRHIANSLAQALQLYQTNQKDSVATLLEQVLLALDADNQTSKSIELHRLLGQLYGGALQAYDQAIPHLEAAIQQLSPKTASGAYLSTLDWLTRSHYWRFESQKTMEYALEGLNLAKELSDIRNEALFAQWLGKVFVLQEQWENALLYYNRMANLASEMDEPEFQFGANLNLACTHFKIGNPKASLPFLDACEEHLKACPKNVILDTRLLIWKGVIYGANERYAESEAILKEVMQIYDSLAIPNRQMHARLELSKLYMKQEKYQACVQLVEATLELLPNKITKFEEKFSYSLLYKSYKKLQNYQKAMESFEQLIDVETELKDINNDKTIRELEEKYQAAEKQQIIEKQKAQRLWLAIALILAILLLGSMVLIISNLHQSRKKLAQQHQIIQQQAEELQTLDKLKSNFFVNVAHELRTPLTLILGPISTALKSNTLDNRNFTLLKKAQLSGQSLKEMITSILDLSKMEAQKMEAEWQATSLYSFTKRLAAAFESQADVRAIRYTFVYQADGQLTVELDQEKLKIILNNLLSNALKFTSSDGEVRFSVQDEGNRLAFRVVDTGRGIHPNDLPHIFDRYYQAKHQSQRVEGGTGIGLALSREYAKLMGGSVQVESTLGKGSVFTATIAKREILGLHIANELQAELEAQELTVTSSSDNLSDQPNAASSPTYRIMVVEDNHSLRDYLRTILAPHYQVLLADNGKKALNMLQQLSPTDYPHFILSDIMMPEMDGYELLENLKNSDQFRTIPVMMLTARANLQDKLKALRIGVDDYLLKPFEEEELLIRIQNLLQNYQNRRMAAQEEETGEAPIEVPVISEEDKVWLEEVELLLQKQLSNSDYTILQLSQDVALSERQTRRRIRELVGLTPKQYFVNIRLQQARQLLETKKYKTISQTASAVGFKSSSAFSRSFVKQYGKLPSTYLHN